MLDISNVHITIYSLKYIHNGSDVDPQGIYVIPDPDPNFFLKFSQTLYRVPWIWIQILNTDTGGEFLYVSIRIRNIDTAHWTVDSHLQQYGTSGEIIKKNLPRQVPFLSKFLARSFRNDQNLQSYLNSQLHLHLRCW